MLIQKEQCGECLVLGRGSDMLSGGEMGEELGDVRFGQVAWMRPMVVDDVSPDPVGVGSFRVCRQPADASHVSYPVQKPRLAGCGTTG
jgi:hypothetical protein